MNYMLGSVNLRDFFFEGLSSNIVEKKSELKNYCYRNMCEMMMMVKGKCFCVVMIINDKLFNLSCSLWFLTNFFNIFIIFNIFLRPICQNSFIHHNIIMGRRLIFRFSKLYMNTTQMCIVNIFGDYRGN